MQLNRFVLLATTTAVLLSVAGHSQAALFNRGGGMIYDDVNNVTWLADGNYAVTSGYAAQNLSLPTQPFGDEHLTAIYADGKMAYGPAKTWVSNLVYAGFSDWRLPTLFGGLNAPEGEFAELLFNQLGLKANESILNTDGDTDQQKANASLFTNLMAGVYWTSSESALNGSPFSINTSNGGWGDLGAGERGPGYAWAMRTGDVGQQSTGNNVPEPGMLPLLALAAIGMAAARRRQPGKA